MSPEREGSEPASTQQAEDETAERDRAERAAARAEVMFRNARLMSAYETAAEVHRRRRLWLVVVSVVVAAYEALWWGFALRARSRALAIPDVEESLASLRAWTEIAGRHWVFTVIAVAVLGVLWWRILRRRPAVPFLELLPDDDARRHDAFRPNAPRPHRVV